MIAPHTLANFESLPKFITDNQLSFRYTINRPHKTKHFFGQPHLLFNHYFNTLFLYFLHKS